MKKLTFLLLLGLIFAAVSNAEPRVNVASRAENEARQKVIDSLASLHASTLDWQIFVIPDADWKAGLKRSSHPDSLEVGSAYSTLALRITYLNASWVMAHTTERIAETLAHEWGHLACQCVSEKMAGTEGQRILPWPIHNAH